MSSITFSEQWDKLHPSCRVVGDPFTTAREYNTKKMEYYKGIMGKDSSVLLQGKTIGKATLVDIYTAYTDSMPLVFWQKDTYSHYTMTNVHTLMKRFYGIPNPFLIILTYKWSSVIKEGL